jgi:hypothetical protein
MAHKEHIVATLTDGSQEDVWAVLDPDKHSFTYLLGAVRELVLLKRGALPNGIDVKRLSFDPVY